MEKKYQVFVSSTFSDLKDERKEVIENLLNAKYIPAGMEMFTASNNEQFKYIKKIIDNCDYYVLIIGGRYGSINPITEKSYTQMEYEYAMEIGIPILVFPFSNINMLSHDKRDTDLTHIENFRKAVMSSQKLCKMWSSPAELVGGVLSSLAEAISDNPRAGWTRGNVYEYEELLEQLHKLQMENQKLSARINELENALEDSSDRIENIADGDELFTIYITRKDRNDYNYLYYNDEIELSWDKIFSLIGPYLKSPRSNQEFKDIVDSAISTQFSYAYYKKVHSDCVQTIKYQLYNRGLISITDTNNQGTSSEMITLTKAGRSYLNQVITIKTKRGEEYQEKPNALQKLIQLFCGR